MPSVFPETNAVRLHPSAQPAHGRSPARADGSPFSELLDSAAPAQDAPAPDRSDTAEPCRADAAPREDSPAAEPQPADPSAKPAKAKPGKTAADCKGAKKTTDKPEASPEDAVTPGEPSTTEKPKIEGTAASIITAAADAVGNIPKDADQSVGTAAPDPSLLFLGMVSLPAAVLGIPIAAVVPVSPAPSTPILPPVVNEIGEIAATAADETSVAAPGIAADIAGNPVISAPAVPVPAVSATLATPVAPVAPAAAVSPTGSVASTLAAPPPALASSTALANSPGLTLSTVPEAEPSAEAAKAVPQAAREPETARPATPFQQAAIQSAADETAPVVQPAAIAKAQISQNPQQPDTPRSARLIDQPGGGPKSDSPASPESSTGRSSTDPVTTNAGQGANSSDSGESGKGTKTATHVAASDGAANSRTAHAEPQAELQVASGGPTAAQPQAATDSSSNPSPASGTVASATAINSQQTVSAAAPVVVAVPLTGLALEISARAHTGKNRFEIRLDPPELGRINVRLDVDRDGHVTSHLMVDRADTLDLLRRDASNLERALQQAGLKTSDNSLQFSLRDQAFSGRDQGDQTMPAMARLVVPDDQLAPLETMQRNYGRL
ncbi:MAG: flagellar hook-length control protein FliK, partial [Alphaproteobacteria bacterium]|nr:flagellar hook-length control protein FliK [Alphaproteobacteria bacterium]